MENKLEVLEGVIHLLVEMVLQLRPAGGVFEAIEVLPEHEGAARRKLMDVRELI